MSYSKTVVGCLALFTFLDTLFVGDAHPCENFLASLVMPSALHHVRGVAVTLTGVNFHPSGRYDGFENEVSDLAYGVGESSVAGDDAICTFDAPKDPGSISQGVNVGQWSFACSLPGRLGTGFVNVGIGSVGQEDARFLYGPEFLIHLLATPVFYNVIGPNFRAYGDAVQVIGTEMIISEASAAEPGHSLFCSWYFACSAEGDVDSEKQTGRSYGAFISSALRSCEVPTLFGIALQVRAVVDTPKLARRDPDTCTTGPVFTICDPPRVLKVLPAATTSKGGELLQVQSSDHSLSSSNLLALNGYRPFIRIGSLWITPNVHLHRNPNQGQLLQVVVPAHRSTSSGVDVTISNNYFGFNSQEGRASCTSVLHFRTPDYTDLTYSSQEIKHLIGLSLASLRSSFDAVSLAIHQPTDMMLRTPSNIASSVAKVSQLITASGPIGGGGIVWVTGTGLQLFSETDYGIARYWLFGNVGVSTAFVSSSLVVCEAPSSEMISERPAAVSSGLVSGNYTFITSLMYNYMPCINALHWWPVSGIAHGGTQVLISLSRNIQATVFCRFGTVLVIGFSSDLKGSIACVSPARNAGFVKFMIGSFHGAVHVSGFDELAGRGNNSSHYQYFSTFD